MTKITLSGIEIKITDAQEMLRMGGPYVGNVWLNEKIIAKNCIVDNFIYQNELNLLFFIKYYRINNYQYFTINFYNLNEGTVYEFIREFDMVYINQFIDKTKLEIFNAFNNKVSQKKMIFDLDRETFVEA
jgi:hypothetical protein